MGGEAAEDWVALSVALSADGRHVAIGAKWNDSKDVAPGHVRIYGFSESQWMQVGSNLISEEPGDTFGDNVALSADGKRVAIGGTRTDDNGAGHVRIYDWNGSQWIQAGFVFGFDLDGEADGDRFGWGVALSADDDRRVAVGAMCLSADGRYAAIGAMWTNDDGNDDGNIRIYGIA